MLEELNTRFGVAGAIQFIPSAHGWPMVRMESRVGGIAEAYLYGAHISSFKTPSFGELLYMSKTAEFTPGKAIRGGIPLIFPQFGPGPLASHGFARNRNWNVIGSGKKPNGDISLSFGLTSSPETEALWPHPFEAEFEIQVSDKLRTIFRVKNTGNSSLNFQLALHSYFTISHIDTILLSDYSNLEFLDNLKTLEKSKENRSALTITSEVDRIYLATPNELSIEDRGLKRKLLINKQGIPDAVVWNPWVEKGASLKDLETDGFKKFVCVESGAIRPAISLEPGTHFEGSQTLSAEPL